MVEGREDPQKSELAAGITLGRPCIPGSWLDLVYKDADTDRTEKVRAANEKLDTLYGAERHALKMDLV